MFATLATFVLNSISKSCRFRNIKSRNFGVLTPNIPNFETNYLNNSRMKWSSTSRTILLL